MKIYFVSVVIALSLLCSVSYADDADLPDDEIKIGVMEFSSGTMDLMPEQAIVVGNIFTQRLAMSVPDNFTIIGHGQLSKVAEDNQMSTEGYVSNRNAAKIAKLAGCRYIIAGIATDLKQRSASTGVNFIVSIGRRIDVATAAADIRLIDAETGESILSIAEMARATQRDSSFRADTDSVRSALPKNVNKQLPKDVPNTTMDFRRQDLNGMEAASMFLLSSKLSLRVIESITGEYPKVESASKKEVTIGIGSNKGARVGMLYRIYTDEGGEEKNIAIVKIKTVKPDSSVAALYSKGYGNLSLVRKDDRVFPTDIYEAKAMIKAKTFIKKR